MRCLITIFFFKMGGIFGTEYMKQFKCDLNKNVLEDNKSSKLAERKKFKTESMIALQGGGERKNH